jgi:alpha-ketoglutarate-dependent 2,4-dichlorophenoxyacetate dioxygenase
VTETNPTLSSSGLQRDSGSRDSLSQEILVRKVLFVGAHAHQFTDMSTAESRLLLSDLLEHATQHERVYTHKWEVGDLVMWDDRATIYRGRRFDLSERRELRRTVALEGGACRDRRAAS